MHLAGPALADVRGDLSSLSWSSDGATIVIYGQVNQGALSFDDGERRTDYGIVANSNASNRLGIRSTGATDRGATLFGNFELQYIPRASAKIDQRDPDPANYDLDKTDIRKLEMAYFSDDIGKFWFGQGSMASDGSAETDFSGTDVIAYSNVAAIGGGPFRRTDGVVSDISTSSAYGNYDGLGRKARIRYDTPTVAGLTLGTSYGHDVLNDNGAGLYDIALRYRRHDRIADLGATLAWSRDTGRDTHILSASVSGMHGPSGISLTLAAARRSDDREAGYGYIKLGWQRDIRSIGTTALAVDYYSGHDIVNHGSLSRSFGIAMVQNVEDWHSQGYLGIRKYNYADSAGSYRDGMATMIGLVVKF